MTRLAYAAWPTLPELPRRPALAVFALAAVAALAVAAALSTGGHASTDSIQQLFEAQTGASISWNPPFMSALLQVLGASPATGSGLSTALFVALTCLAIWLPPLALALAANAPRVSIAAWTLCVAMAINPVLVAYAGIVWKDVLFGALAGSAMAAGLLALSGRTLATRLAWAAGCAALVGVLPLVRQQGLVIGPVLVLLPLLACALSPGLTASRRAALAVAVLVVVAGTHLAGKTWSNARVPGNEGRSMSVGFQSIFQFDLAGMEAYARRGPLVEMGASPEALDELQRFYTPERIDFLDRTPALVAFLRDQPDGLGALWARAVVSHPVAYLTHRREVMSALLGLGNPRACLPVHVGFDGIPEQMSALGLLPGTDMVDRQLYQTLKPMFDGPLFRHVTYIAILATLVVVTMLRRRRTTRVALMVAAGAVVLFYASFVPTAIACDFRYLFPAIPCLLVLLAAYAFGWSGDVEHDQVKP